MGPAGCRTLTDVLCEELNVQSEDILDRDLQLVTRQQPTRIGPDGEYFLAPRIDDLECAATTLLAFLDAAPDCDSACAPVWAIMINTLKRLPPVCRPCFWQAVRLRPPPRPPRPATTLP